MREGLSLWLNRVMLSGLVVQFYTAGWAIFGHGFRLHGRLGWSLIVTALLNALLALAGFGRRSRRFRVAVGLLLVTVLQPILIFVLGPISRALAALHPVNGLLAVALAAYGEWLGRASFRGHREPPAKPGDARRPCPVGR